MTDFNIRDTQSLPLIIESIARRVVAVERRSPQYTEAVSVVEVQDLDSRPDPEGPDTYCYVVLTADWYETSPNGFLPPPNPPIPVYQWITSTGPPVVPPTGIPDPLLLSDGTAGAPTYSFASDTNTGIYRIGSDDIGMSCGGVKRFGLNSTAMLALTSSGYIQLGPQNASYCHINTDVPAFYMNKPLDVAGRMTVNGGDLQVYGGRHIIDLNSGSGLWWDSQLLVQSADTSTTSNTNVGMTFHNRRYSIAPVIRNYGPNGESVDFMNNPGSGYIPIRASAFTVSSTIRIKQDIEAVEDSDAIALAEKFLLTSFWPKVRPQNVHLSERFKEENAQWVAASPENKELTPTTEDWESHDHDCCTDACAGDADVPCQVTVNDTRRFGGLAEWWGEVAPEQVNFDSEGIADSIDVDQVATTALGAVGALSRKLTMAMEIIDSLQERLAVLEARK